MQKRETSFLCATALQNGDEKAPDFSREVCHNFLIRLRKKAVGKAQSHDFDKGWSGFRWKDFQLVKEAGSNSRNN